jgi:hypothetical protein
VVHDGRALARLPSAFARADVRCRLLDTIRDITLARACDGAHPQAPGPRARGQPPSRCRRRLRSRRDRRPHSRRQPRTYHGPAHLGDGERLHATLTAYQMRASPAARDRVSLRGGGGSARRRSCTRGRRALRGDTARRGRSRLGAGPRGLLVEGLHPRWHAPRSGRRSRRWRPGRSDPRRCCIRLVASVSEVELSDDRNGRPPSVMCIGRITLASARGSSSLTSSPRDAWRSARCFCCHVTLRLQPKCCALCRPDGGLTAVSPLCPLP